MFCSKCSFCDLLNILTFPKKQQNKISFTVFVCAQKCAIGRVKLGVQESSLNKLFLEFKIEENDRKPYSNPESTPMQHIYNLCFVYGFPWY